jgi:hypothetical protein
VSDDTNPKSKGPVKDGAIGSVTSESPGMGWFEWFCDHVEKLAAFAVAFTVAIFAGVAYLFFRPELLDGRKWLFGVAVVLLLGFLTSLVWMVRSRIKEGRRGSRPEAFLGHRRMDRAFFALEVFVFGSFFSLFGLLILGSILLDDWLRQALPAPYGSWIVKIVLAALAVGAVWEWWRERRSESRD